MSANGNVSHRHRLPYNSGIGERIGTSAGVMSSRLSCDCSHSNTTPSWGSGHPKSSNTSPGMRGGLAWTGRRSLEVGRACNVPQSPERWAEQLRPIVADGEMELAHGQGPAARATYPQLATAHPTARRAACRNDPHHWGTRYTQTNGSASHWGVVQPKNQAIFAASGSVSRETSSI
jgi:hypothetical protein